MPIFDKVLQSQTLDSHKAYWFKALSYLKQGDTAQAIATLETLVENKGNFNYDKAQKLLKVLE